MAATLTMETIHLWVSFHRYFHYGCVSFFNISIFFSKCWKWTPWSPVKGGRFGGSDIRWFNLFHLYQAAEIQLTVIKWCSQWYPGIHNNDVIMGTIASQTTSLVIVYSAVYSDADQRKHRSSASLAFVRRIHRRPVNSPHKWPVTRKRFHLMTSLCTMGVCTPVWHICITYYINWTVFCNTWRALKFIFFMRL